ncbi:hypothetical protein DL762_000983 [Monosporascus cannonballus]|uniref:Endonuclease/exonuclease/phosphatase domain-containing protein n=1 Tax=Monosporascus cannonballus TaxID=155416 RepID=A0ABY0HLZ4_9PEZI|nr:hypothetical protein DL763_005229 [Monosporascus cannonballus]RYO93778.1 hypothetical protein DL762_000983 [Monosporascus cannonballus]
MTNLVDKVASDAEARKQLTIPEALISSPFGALVLETIRATEAKKKLVVPWRLDEPYGQPYYEYNETVQVWELTTPRDYMKNKGRGQQPSDDSSSPVDGLALYSWNIDQMLPFAEARMETALAHLERLTARISPKTGTVVFLQECTLPYLETITRSQWVRDRFYITDVDTLNWTSGHAGTTMLVDRQLPVTACFRVHFTQTLVDRDAHFVDILMRRPRTSDSQELDILILRLCNVHLESFDWETPLRPAQMRVIAKYIHQDGVRGAVVAGDFSSLQPYDRALHTEHELRDAFLEFGGREDEEAGFTWGLQSPEVMRADGPSRLDKIMFTGACLQLRRFEVFGRDVQLEDQEKRAELIRLGCEKPWITDHLGVMAELHVVAK